MAEEVFIPKPLLEQILDEVFTTLEKQEEFDQQTIQSLKQLARTEELKKPVQVSEAIKPTQGTNL